MIRRAEFSDLEAVESIYDEIHDAEEEKRMCIGWQRGIYPTRATAEEAIKRNDLFVLEEGGDILAAAIINQIQVDAYYDAPWEHMVEDEHICVLHTLVIPPRAGHKGLGKQFVSFYEQYAMEHDCFELRIDTNEKNETARSMYKKLGYREIAIVPTTFNGIKGVNLVLLEKWMGSDGFLIDFY